MNYKLGRYQQAIADYSQAIDLKPKRSSYYGNRAASKMKLALYEEAVLDYTSAINLSPRDMTFVRNRGFALYKLQRHEEALTDYDKVINSDKLKTFDTWRLRALAKKELGMHQASQLDFTLSDMNDYKFCVTGRKVPTIKGIRSIDPKK